MASAGESSKRNSAHPMNFLYTGLLLLLLCDVPILVSGCKSWEKCLTISECRQEQKRNNIQAGRMADLAFVFPCDESLNVMTICCTIRKPGEQGFEQLPGYNITYGEPEASQSDPISSPPLPAPLPLKQIQNEEPVSQETAECGLFRGGEISGVATRGQFPWLALLGKCNKETGEFAVDCGGSLISNRYVLTSAQCLDKLEAAPDTVRLGEYDRSLDDSESSGFPQNYAIEKIIVHERFNYPFLKNDIALVRLESCTPQFTDWLRPICLPEAPSPDSIEYIMAGWRTHGSRGMPATPTPEFGPLSLNNSGLCDLPIPVQPVAETQICFGSNPSSCFGDFGGPLIEIIKTGATERAVQAAIFTYGGSKCDAKFSGELYTKVFPFRDWIIKNMDV